MLMEQRCILRESNQTRAWLRHYLTMKQMAIGHIMNYSNTTTYKTFIARGGAGNAEQKLMQ
jgi:hypothetical protein